MAGVDTGGRPRRKRNAAATRADILASARALFTRLGYERAGVREIASAAGVDPALVVRYFGSKEQLFAEAVAQVFAAGAVLGGDRATLGQRLARLVLEKDTAGSEYDPLIALLRSAANERASALLRAGLDDLFIYPLARQLGGQDAELRAGLIAASLLGLALARDVIRSAPLAAAETEALIALTAPPLQGYIDGNVPKQGANATPLDR